MKNVKVLLSIAAMAILAISCSKNEAIPEVQGKTRIIYGSFEFTAQDAQEPAVRSALADDGATPLWTIGDKIMVQNETGCQEIELIAGSGEPAAGYGYILENDNICIATTLTGQLYAVYPAAVATETSCPDGKPAFQIPTIQDGSFGNANICVAKLSETEQFKFKNAAAILKFSQTKGNGVKKINIKSARKITGKITVSFDNEDLGISWNEGSYDIIAQSETELTDFYIAMPALASIKGFTGVLTISALKEEGCGILEKNPGIMLQRNKIYLIKGTKGEEKVLDALTYNSNRGLINGHEYVEVAGMRWATENLAVTESGKRIFKGNRTGTNGIGMDTGHVIGDLFQWAATDVNYISFSSKCVYGDTENSFNFKPGCDFTHEHSPYYDPTADPKYLYPNTGDHGYAYGSKKILIPADDAATVNWGAPWRIPGITAQSQDPANVSEFKALREATVAVWDQYDQGTYIFLPVDDADKGKRLTDLNDTYKRADAILFFPSPGFGENSNFSYAGNFGCYWTNCIRSGDRQYAYVFRLCGNNSYNENAATFYNYNGDFVRWRGASIRAVAPIPAE